MTGQTWENTEVKTALNTQPETQQQAGGEKPELDCAATNRRRVSTGQKKIPHQKSQKKADRCVAQTETLRDRKMFMFFPECIEKKIQT